MVEIKNMFNTVVVLLHKWFLNGSFACNNAKKMEFEWTFTEDLNGNEMKNGF